MPKDPKPKDPQPEDPGALWRDQPPEKLADDLERFANRRARELHSGTRSEILMSIAGALFFVAVMAWRFGSAPDRAQQLGLLAVAAWALISLYRFRRRIWGEAPPPDALAATSLEYYRRALEERRNHLRNAWLWHGPLVLACVVFVATLMRRTPPGRLRNALPFVALLALWTVFAARRRLSQVKELQRELDEIGRM